MIRRLLGWTGITVLVVVLAVAGYWLLFTTFMVYDDEGYVLISLKHFSEHGALYGQVYTQYGPFFYVAHDALHRLLHFAWTNTNGRLLTLFYWGGTALVCAALVWRRTRSTAATAFTLAGVFAYLWVMVHEPGHPGGCIGFLIALAAWIGAEADPARRPASVAAVGAIGAALALTKINVGGLLLIAATTWLVVHAEDRRVRRWGGWAAAALLILMPWALMRHLLGQSWAQEYACVAMLGALGVFMAAQVDPLPIAGRRAGFALLGGAMLVGLVTITIVLARGTPLAGLVEGVLLDPLKHPGVYFFSFPWRPGTLLVAVGALILTVWGWRRPAAPGVIRMVAAARLLAMAAFVLAALLILPISNAALGMSFGVSLAGLCALALRAGDEGRRDARVRQWLALVLVLQFLHAYPVAGSQINWATFLWIPLLVLAVRDAWLKLAPAIPPRGQFLTPLAALAAFGLAGFTSYKLLAAGLTNRRDGEALALPGAEGIIVPDDTVFALRIMAENAREHASMLFGLPGIYSFNLWTQLPTPTLANATHWFSLLSTGQQRAIIARLRAEPHAALIVQGDTLKYLVQHGFRVRGELADYLGTEFVRAFTVDNYEFWVHRDRLVAPLLTGRLVVEPGTPDAKRLDLTLPPLCRPVASFQIWELAQQTRRYRFTLDADNASLDATPLNEAGRPTAPACSLPWRAQPPDGLVRLGVHFRGAADNADQWLVFLFDSEGRRLAALRVLGKKG